MKALFDVIIQIIFGKWINKLILFMSIYVFYSTSLQMLRLVSLGGELSQIIISISIGFFCFFIILKKYFLFIKELRKLSWLLRETPIWTLFVCGLILRLLWIFVFDAQPGSDGAVYLALAKKLLSANEYEIAGTKAYWPVGFPVYLSIWLRIFGDTKFAYLASNLFLYGLSFFGVYKLINVFGDKVSKIGLVAFVLWPNIIFNNATPEKETLVLALFPWAMYFFLKGLNSSNYWVLILCGIVLGVITLVQPSLQLLVLFAVLLSFIILGLNRKKFFMAIMILAGAIVVVSPWTLRNYEIFSKFVLVSTNGGDNFYRANNPLATGGYTPVGAVDLNNLNEVQKDEQGKVLAKKWILSNPTEFLGLILEKQVRFLGDDSVGLYNTFKVGKASNNDFLYVFFKCIANVWWMMVWFLLGVFSLDSIYRHTRMNYISVICFWVWLYLFSIHSVFESAGKYHFPVLWVLCVLLSLYSTKIKPNKENVFSGLYAKNAYSLIREQFGRFIVIGGFATILQYLILIGLVQTLEVDAVLASSIGFLISALFNYALNYRYTFS